MNINPANTAAIQFPMADELDYLPVRHGRRAIDAVVPSQELPTAPAVAEEQFAGDEFVGGNIVERQQPAELLRVRGPVRQETNPDRRVDQHHLSGGRRRRRVFTTPGHVFRIGFASLKTPKTLISGAADQRLEAKSYSFGVRHSTTSCFRRREEFFVDVQRLLHEGYDAILIGCMGMAVSYLRTPVSLSGGAPLHIGAWHVKCPRYGVSVFTAREDTVIIRGFRDRRRRQVFA